MSVIDRETATAEYEKFCKAWKIGRKVKYMDSEALEQYEIQKETIIDCIAEGILHLDESNVMQYTMEDPVAGIEKLSIPKPAYKVLVATDKYKENAANQRAIALIAAATGEPEKLVSQFSINTDMSNIMMVLGHFLMG